MEWQVQPQDVDADYTVWWDSLTGVRLVHSPVGWFCVSSEWHGLSATDLVQKYRALQSTQALMGV